MERGCKQQDGKDWHYVLCKTKHENLRKEKRRYKSDVLLLGTRAWLPTAGFIRLITARTRISAALVVLVQTEI